LKFIIDINDILFPLVKNNHTIFFCHYIVQRGMFLSQSLSVFHNVSTYIYIYIVNLNCFVLLWAGKKSVIT